MSQQNGHSETDLRPEEELVDPEDVTEEQGDLMFAWKNNGQSGEAGPDPMRVVDDWMPSADQWSEKTNISLNQAQPMAMIPVMEEMFPDIIGDGVYKEFIDGGLEDYKQLLTSWEGESREEQMNVLKSLPGSDSGGVSVVTGGEDGDDPESE